MGCTSTRVRPTSFQGNLRVIVTVHTRPEHFQMGTIGALQLALDFTYSVTVTP